MAQVRLNAILPKDFKPDALLRAPREAIEGYIKKTALPAFKSTVQTWSPASKPDFEEGYGRKGDEEYGEVAASQSTDRIYRFVSKGTKVRFATMTPGFMPKTAPGRIPAEAGAGTVAFVNPLFPHPGIKARKFDRQIRVKTRAAFKAEAKAVFAQAVRDSQHGR